MKVYVSSSDSGDRMIVTMPATWEDPRPLARVLPLRAKQHAARARVCLAMAEDLSRMADRLIEAVEALRATGVWREYSPPRARQLPANLRAHEEANDPATRWALRAHHALVTAARALQAIAAKEPTDE